MRRPTSKAIIGSCCPIIVALLALNGTAGAQSDVLSDGSSSALFESLPGTKAMARVPTIRPRGVRWKTLLNQTFRFMLTEHAYRYLNEPATRTPGRPFFKGYIDSVGALHGWADGDPFYVNYVGHPMQGSVAGYLWVQNDTRYRYAEFGRNPDYWKSRLRAAAFATAYSEQFEIGPFSEASIGNVQAFFPQHGFADHVITPTIGLSWMIAEDALDRYLVRAVERKTQNRYVRALVRGGASPSHSLANVVSGKWPWDRLRDHPGEIALAPGFSPFGMDQPVQQIGVAPFEFAANTYAFAAPRGPCIGGGATAAFRMSAEWQMVLDVNGCKMAGLEKNLSGDSLSYMVGPRWTPLASGRLSPYFQILLGGNKLTQERMFPEAEAALTQLIQTPASQAPDHQQYTQQLELDGLAMAAGMGVDFHFNRALGLRLIGVEYTHSWINDLNGYAAPGGFQVKTGLVLRMGNW